MTEKIKQWSMQFSVESATAFILYECNYTNMIKYRDDDFRPAYNDMWFA